MIARQALLPLALLASTSGLAAQQAFAKVGLTASIAPRLVQAENIGQALQFAQSGNADVAILAGQYQSGGGAKPAI